MNEPSRPEGAEDPRQIDAEFMAAKLADRLRQVVRVGDEVVRVDGDRFAVLDRGEHVLAVGLAHQLLGLGELRLQGRDVGLGEPVGASRVQRAGRRRHRRRRAVELGQTTPRIATCLSWNVDRGGARRTCTLPQTSAIGPQLGEQSFSGACWRAHAA